MYINIRSIPAFYSGSSAPLNERQTKVDEIYHTLAQDQEYGIISVTDMRLDATVPYSSVNVPHYQICQTEIAGWWSTRIRR